MENLLTLLRHLDHQRGDRGLELENPSDQI